MRWMMDISHPGVIGLLTVLLISRLINADVPLSDIVFDDENMGDGRTGVTVPITEDGKAIQYSVRLSEDSSVQASARGEDPIDAKAAAELQQGNFLQSLRELDADMNVVVAVQAALNAVIVEFDPAILNDVRLMDGVLSVSIVHDFEASSTFDESIDYLGLEVARNAGYDGEGVTVAVLDTGIDYHHANLGGSGDIDDYDNNDATVIETGTFPTAKVVGGYDFATADPDPLDSDGHGTSIADIIAGTRGVAPAALLYAVQVCVSTSECPGPAILQGIDFAVDPNHDGSLDGRADIITLALGARYGNPFDDDLSAAVDDASALGIVTVASAGNSGDVPYVSGTPASARTAISVAETGVPGSFPYAQVVFNAPADVAGRVFLVALQPWSTAPTDIIEKVPLVFVPQNQRGCDEFQEDLDGLAILVFQGVCAIGDKVNNIAAAGGVAALLGFATRGAEPNLSSYSGPQPPIPGYTINREDTLSIIGFAAGRTAEITIDPAQNVARTGSVFWSSSRGPQFESDTLIKPEIASPGALISASVGTGSDESTFGGTSGAAAAISGFAALLVQSFGGTRAPEMGKGKGKGNSKGPKGSGDAKGKGNSRTRRLERGRGRQQMEGKGGAKGGAKGPSSSKGMKKGSKQGEEEAQGLTPLEVKALLMNNAESQILDSVYSGVPAPITRVGAGEIRIDQALDAPIIAWEADVPSGSLSFGFIDVADEKIMLKKTIYLRTLDGERHTYAVDVSFRDDDDEATAAVEFSIDPYEVDVRPGRSSPQEVEVTMTIFGDRLRGNYMNSGDQAVNPIQLTINEYDGWIHLRDVDGSHTIDMPWHVLPRKAARVEPDTFTFDLNDGESVTIGLHNDGAGIAQNRGYALLALSDDQSGATRGGENPMFDIRAFGIKSFPTLCSGDTFGWGFAMNTWERLEMLISMRIEIFIDVDQDDTYDYMVVNEGFNGFNDGRQAGRVFDLSTGGFTTPFFVSNPTNTGNTQMFICGTSLGWDTPEDVDAAVVNMKVLLRDFRDRRTDGTVTDEVGPFTVKPNGEQYTTETQNVDPHSYNPEGLIIVDNGRYPGTSQELGVMLFTNNDEGSDARRGGATEETEMLIFTAV